MWTSTIKDKQLQEGTLRVVVTFSQGEVSYDKTFATSGRVDEKWLLNCIAQEIRTLESLEIEEARLEKGLVVDARPIIDAQEAHEALIGKVIPK